MIVVQGLPACSLIQPSTYKLLKQFALNCSALNCPEGKPISEQSPLGSAAAQRIVVYATVTGGLTVKFQSNPIPTDTDL